jgi:hypothetical protein
LSALHGGFFSSKCCCTSIWCFTSQPNNLPIESQRVSTIFGHLVFISRTKVAGVLDVRVRVEFSQQTSYPTFEQKWLAQPNQAGEHHTKLDKNALSTLVSSIHV